MKDKNIKLWLLLLGCLFVILPVCWILITRLEGDEPQVVFELPSSFFGISQDISFSVSDAKSGLKKIWLGLLKDKKEIVLLEKNFPAAGLFGGGKVQAESFNVPVIPKNLGISDGKAVLRIVTTDFSWRRWGNGNRVTLEKEITIDTRRPDIEILSRAHNIIQGGSGLIIYRLSEPCRESGVSVGENFFPGYPGNFKDNTILMAFFALNYDQGRGTDMFVKAIDLAGNSAREGFTHYIKNKSFKKDIINISDSFLNLKVPEFDADIPRNSNDSLLDRFTSINRDLRQKNYNAIVAACEKTDSRLYWEDIFLRLPKSSPQAGFADHRTYQYQDRVIDHQVHLGIDLASVERSPVPAANSGKIVFVERLGIYGKTVIIDHGFGLFSMYSHLSSFAVKMGDIVSKGGHIGDTGMTGLAGGDHLHFSMLVHNTFVNPIEWWDASWIKNNIMDKIMTEKARLGE